MNALLLNHLDICNHLYQGNLENAIDVFLVKTKDVVFTPVMRNMFLSSLNYALYNYILIKESISLHTCCVKNEKLISQATNDTIPYVGITIITSYKFDPDYLFEKYQNVHVRNAIYYIHQHLNSTLTLEKVSSAVNVNPSYLCQLFRKEIQISFSDYILNRRIELAESLVRSSECSIQEIAIRCGFKNVSYFSTCYKKVTGRLPSEDRI